MQASDDKITPSTWIPWIMALAVLLGWNAFAPDDLATEKEKPQDGVGLVQPVDDLPAPGVMAHPHVGLAPSPSGSGWRFGAVSTLLDLEPAGERATSEPCRGGVQGRAPPLRA